MLKYHLFEKRDSGIINCIQKEDESIETDQKKVKELLSTATKEMQINERWDFLEETEFPKLNRLNEGEMKEIIEKLSTGKAIAFDGISNNLFKRGNVKKDKKPTNSDKTAKKLRNLWRIPPNKHDDIQET